MKDGTSAVLLHPFGLMDECHLISANDLPLLHQFGKNDLLRTFLGHVLESENMDTSEIHVRNLNAKEVLTLQRNNGNYIPNRRWNSQNFWVGREQRPRTSTSIQERLAREKNQKFFKESQLNQILKPNIKTIRSGMMNNNK